MVRNIIQGKIYVSCLSEQRLLQTTAYLVLHEVQKWIYFVALINHYSVNYKLFLDNLRRTTYILWFPCPVPCLCCDFGDVKFRLLSWRDSQSVLSIPRYRHREQYWGITMNSMHLFCKLTQDTFCPIKNDNLQHKSIHCRM